MRAFASYAAAGSLLVMAACSPQVPDSAAGIDGDPFAPPPAAGTTITGEPLVPPARVSSEPVQPAAAPRSPGSAAAAGTFTTASTAASGADIARETAAALAVSSTGSGGEPLQANPSNPAPQLAGDGRISDENDFEAVAARQSIESDAARLERQRAQYQQVQPVAVPERTEDTGPNIVRYALGTSNPKGVRVYSRTGINLKARNQRNCAEFASPDQAQVAFLATGGPERDRKALDPDGDGYACGWDPAPYRLAVQN
ncbi:MULTISPECIES: excalibur calcium-binding domain-containing protein [Leisingera]|jgi:hypothetical protein|uniref:excalibur calcium-binding domain-containing protein n=1 Tax=Leisingera TaxID=191028 RepID=UPI00115217E5|nr:MULTISPECIES: excalibur calcium-binding domain-containing protein [Leisingera]QDI76347.1 hypothetical protein R2C4_11495 [Leisingera aquaemixtae]UWQ38497.1 excalibur calcium-binding domain-containing protein [Leisingera aquaemixtae]